MSPVRSFWKLCVRDEFSAAHFLRHYEGKCEALHGHNFGIEICVKGPTLQPGVELLVDFKNIKSALKKTLLLLDHRNLNDLEFFRSVNPTSENIAFFLFQEMKKEFMGNPLFENIVLLHVTVSECPSQSATYMEEEK